MDRPQTVPEALVRTLTRVQAFAEARQVSYYLVGGLLRDQLLGRSLTYLNVDLVVARGALATTRALAACLQGAFVPLDEAAGIARVVVTTEAGRVELDVSDFRGATLAEDLGRRDFTVNAMAIALQDWLRNPHEPGPLIDPLGGRQALARKELIACFPETFEDDPVRILRAVRFAAQLGLTFDQPFQELMARSVRSLSRVSGERVRDELIGVLETDRAGEALRALEALGAVDVLFPELVPGRGMDQGNFHHLDVLGHQLETVCQADRILVDLSEFAQPLRDSLAAYCADQPVERRSRKSLIKLGGLLHDVGKPANRQVHEDGEIWFIGHEHSGAELVRSIVKRLRLSNREGETVYRLVRHHLRPGFLSREPELTRRAIYRFYKDLEEDGPACVLTWWSDRMATRGRLSRLDQIDQQRARAEELLGAYFFKAEEVVRPARLVDGHRLMEAFHLTPGPVIGELLGAIEEAQAEGRLRSVDEALALAEERLKAHRKT